jgi:hypothetical protein
MPNWCYNTLIIEAEPQVIAKIKAQLSAPYEDKYQDFKSDTWITQTVQKDFSFWNIIRPPADKMDEYHSAKGWSDGKSYGDTEYNWYNWNTSNWGVKWDASDPELVEEDETSLQYRFNTPWGVAEEAMNTLSAQYPEVEFCLSFEEETGWGGELLFTEGSSIIINEFAQKCYACDKQWQHGEEYWDEYDDDTGQHKCEANGSAIEDKEKANV